MQYSHSNNIKNSMDSIYGFSIIIVFMSPFSYPVLLLLLVLRFISLPSAFKMKESNDSDEHYTMLCSHAHYYNQITLIIMIVGISIGLALQKFPIEYPVMQGTLIVLTTWCFFRLYSGRTALRQNKMPSPIPKGFEIHEAG